MLFAQKDERLSRLP